MEKVLLPKAELTLLDVNDIIEYENNNKLHWKKQINAIEEAIERFTYIDEIVVDVNNVIIIWHWRLEAIKNLWYNKIEVKKLNIHKKDEKALRYIHNKLSELDVQYNLEKIELEKKEWVNFKLWWVDFADFKTVPVQLEQIETNNPTQEEDYSFNLKETKGIQIPVRQTNHYELLSLLQEAHQKGLDIWNLFYKLLKNERTTNNWN